MLCNHDDLFLARASRAAALSREWVGGGDGRMGKQSGAHRAPWLHAWTTHIGLPRELLTDGHYTESCSPEVVRAWNSPGATERTDCLDAKTLVLGPDINLQLLQFRYVLNAKKKDK